MSPPTPSGLDDLIADFLAAAERGEAPDPAGWLARHPDHAAGLAAFLADYGRFEALLGMPQRPVAVQTADFREPPDAGEDAPPFGGYELLGEVGRGGMGTVYRARIIGTSLVVALKQIRPGENGGLAVGRFREEIESAAGLRHPNIVPVYHVGEQGGRPFYTMALVEGGSLERHLGRLRGHLGAAAALMAKTARAVHFAHQRRVLHRDLKPANILLDEHGEPHVADFGLAARMDEAGAAAGGPPAGSLPWMAPEAVRGDALLTTAVDVWALGVILYEMLTGERPFRGSTWQEVRAAILEASPAPPRRVSPAVPRDLEAICLRCLEKSPQRRYESASAVALELERWLNDEPVRARPPGPGEQLARWARHNPGLTAGLGVVLVLLALLAWAAFSIADEMAGRLADAVCRNNEFSARQAAGIVQTRLEGIGTDLLKAASDPDLHGACTRRKTAAAREALLKHFGRGAGRVKSAFVVDQDGMIFVTTEPQGQVGSRDVTGRDYRVGAIDLERQGKAGLASVYVSRVFRSENDGLDKLAVSAAFLPGAGGAPWVLVATVTTDADFGQRALPSDQVKAVLIAPLDTNPPRPNAPAEEPGYAIMAHPAFGRGERSVRFPRGSPLPPGSLAHRRPGLGVPPGETPFPADTSYTDPAGDHGHPEYRGRWLAGSARVGDTELVVLVQQRHDQAVAPHERVFGRFLAWVGGAIAAGLGAFALLRLRGRRRGATAG